MSPSCIACSYYTVVSLSLVPRSWFCQLQQQLEQRPLTGDAVRQLAHQLLGLRAELNMLQRLVRLRWEQALRCAAWKL